MLQTTGGWYCDKCLTYYTTDRHICPAKVSETETTVKYQYQFLGIDQGPRYDWKPQPDITAYELALCLPVIFGNCRAFDPLEGLPPEAKRHFDKKGG